MNYENEITVKVNTTYDKLHNILLKNNFIIKEEYTVKDTYMINELNSYNLPIDKTNYFVKKAVLVLNDTVRSNK